MADRWARFPLGVDHILHKAGYRVIVAHFNHQLRPEAGQEADSVSARARSLDLAFVTDEASALKSRLSQVKSARDTRESFNRSSIRNPMCCALPRIL